MPVRGGDALSRALRELRVTAGLSQVATAERAGVSQALVARFETGRQVPRPDQVKKLCDVYGTVGDARRRVIEMAKDAEPAPSGSSCTAMSLRLRSESTG